MSTSKRKFHEAFGKREVEFDKTCFAGSKVEVPTSVEDFEATLEKASAAGRIVVVAFIKEKVLVCYHLRKTFYEMSSRFAEVQFLEVDCDKTVWIESGNKLNINAVPSVVFFKNKKVVAKIEGAYPQKLKDLLSELYEDKEVGLKLAKEDGIPAGLEDLRYYIDPTKTECLNVQNEGEYFDFLDKKSIQLVSDCDEQIILGIGFNQNVMVDCFRIKAPESTGPKSIKIFVNLLNFDFSDAEKQKCSQEITLSADQLQGQDLIRLQRTSFNSVKSLHIFIHENQGNVDSSEIESLILYGKPLKPSLSVAGYNLFMS